MTLDERADGRARFRARCGRGQASIALVAAMSALLVVAAALGGLVQGVALRSDAQRAADIAAVAGARAMLDAYPRLFTAPGEPGHLEKRAYLELGRAAARDVAARNGQRRATVRFPDGATLAPVRIEVRAGEARATAELAPGAGAAPGAFAAGGGYDGPLAYRQGKPMRPDVAVAFDRMSAAARADGVALMISSAFRSDAEQAVLWARNPDPRWVAPPGRSLHRNGTELDLGPPAAYAWLRANAGRFHFIVRYPWEPWHVGYALNARSAPPAGRDHDDGRHAARPGTIPSFVPARFSRPIARAAQRWNVSGTLLAAQIHAESGFNPFARSPAGARGIAQFMPGTARQYGLVNPYDADAAIDAQARMMRDLLRRFGSVPLALAAYNAGPARVAACACVPAIPETRGYVARILGLMGGAGEMASAALAVRLVA